MTDNWHRRLPKGVTYQGRTGNGFRLGITMPADEAGLLPLAWPEHPEHVFKIAVSTDTDSTSSQTPSDQVINDAADLYRPYCGHTADAWAFMKDQQKRARAAMEAAGLQMMHAEVSNMLRNTFGTNRPGSGWTYRPGTPPSVPALPTYDIPETRRTMHCDGCQTDVAVYNLALYCPRCGQLAPAEQFTHLIALQRERLALLDDLAEDLRQRYDDSGSTSATYESTIKDGFAALETYLKQRFTREAPSLPKSPSPTTFQRLPDVNAMFKQHLGVDLETAATPPVWAALLDAAAIRHVLTHNAGIVDQQFLNRMPNWPQGLGQRLHIDRSDADTFLTALEAFTHAAL